jgi:hypothetical protein
LCHGYILALELLREKTAGLNACDYCHHSLIERPPFGANVCCPCYTFASLHAVMQTPEEVVSLEMQVPARDTRVALPIVEVQQKKPVRTGRVPEQAQQMN